MHIYGVHQYHSIIQIIFCYVCINFGVRVECTTIVQKVWIYMASFWISMQIFWTNIYFLNSLVPRWLILLELLILPLLLTLPWISISCYPSTRFAEFIGLGLLFTLITEWVLVPELGELMSAKSGQSSFLNRSQV